MARLLLNVGAEAPIGESASLAFSDELGSPAVERFLVLSTGDVLRPAVRSVTLSIEAVVVAGAVDTLPFPEPTEAELEVDWLEPASALSIPSETPDGAPSEIEGGSPAGPMGDGGEGHCDFNEALPDIFQAALPPEFSEFERVYVPADYPTINDAIQVAFPTGGLGTSDVIIFVDPGTYVENLIIDADSVGPYSLILVSTGGPDVTTIDGSSPGQGPAILIEGLGGATDAAV